LSVVLFLPIKVIKQQAPRLRGPRNSVHRNMPRVQKMGSPIPLSTPPLPTSGTAPFWSPRGCIGGGGGATRGPGDAAAADAAPPRRVVQGPTEYHHPDGSASSTRPVGMISDWATTGRFDQANAPPPPPPPWPAPSQRPSVFPFEKAIPIFFGTYFVVPLDFLPWTPSRQVRMADHCRPDEVVPYFGPQTPRPRFGHIDLAPI